ncbi:hypothetical protein CGLO_18212 [Colletotrichum gloeosporioides Cg-14]|uniref:Uncharacterized protein n=1 Tax=Colletotrichum gloeosporioides (strain Cg-14) TaxID=1237896 RepID=T0JUX9_COLGC|nr:hypothetical protein CGLO_18212 [Colletotrichum gloeosporioides Cg-14]
MADRGNGRKS